GAAVARFWPVPEVNPGTDDCPQATTNTTTTAQATGIRRHRGHLPSLGRVTSTEVCHAGTADRRRRTALSVRWPPNDRASRHGVPCAAMAEPPDHRELRIPLGGLSRHAVRRPRLHRMMLSWPLAAALAGAAAAIAGVVLVTAEPTVDVG